MNVEESACPKPQAIVNEWLKAVNQCWIRSVMEPEETRSSEEGRLKQDERASGDMLFSALKTLSAFTAAMSEPSAVNAAYRGLGTLPELGLALLKSGVQGYSTLHEHIIAMLEKIGLPPGDYNLDNLDRETIRTWSEIYKKEIKRYFNIPQLGLNRFYQERLNQAMDKYHTFNTSLAEFMQLLCLPFEKSVKVMQEKIEELTSSGDLPENTKGYYRMWVKILEGNFMTLFKSSEYNRVLSETLAAFEEYLEARNRIIQDILQSLPVPTSKEMDDLYKEMYLLKKKVRDIEKANGQDRQQRRTHG